ncbi:TRAP-type C4-dicarboxylate transport system, small permease component [Cohaesibacter sp. ES.047]|uniref:TRAP transporter small permease subunit n=1 Tax=Cohaesibacter sp. ES.047 TaxID=1798205 RepID=UPI000BB79567|nr:TRAP transporter small permease [Cohaesibacter sp. ES.047]SNY91321.1 TRAP-type C4-dicarboxylate transport system, small permease component [Cohaesibacter sp. ES.047]
MLVDRAESTLRGVRILNKWIALLVGAILFACATLVLADITLRQVGSSFGGTDEITGYVMAIATAWGMSFALTELSHVRIDFLRSLAPQKGRAMLDLFALLMLSLTVSIIAKQCWPVVATSLKNSSTANTPLETPLIWVQIPWFAGWIWFAISSWIVFVAAGALIVKGEFQTSERTIGIANAEEEWL